MREQPDPTLHWDAGNSRWLRWDGNAWNPELGTPMELVPRSQVAVLCPACQQPTLVDPNAKGWTCASCAAENSIIECPWCRIISPWQNPDKALCGFCQRMAQRTFKFLKHWRCGTAERLAGWQTWFGAPPATGTLVTGGRVLQATDLPFAPTSIVIIGMDTETVTFTGMDNTTAQPGAQVCMSDSELTGVWVGGRGEYQVSGDYDFFGYGVWEMLRTHDRTQTLITIGRGSTRLDLSNEVVPASMLGSWLGPLAARVPQSPTPAAAIPAPTEQLTPSTIPQPVDRDYVTVLNELAQLHEQGILTDEEYAQKKADVLRRV